MKNLLIRSLTGAIFTGSIVATMFWDAYAFNGLIFLFAMLTVYEFYKMFNKDDKHPQIAFGLIVCGITFILISAVSFNLVRIDLLILLIPLLFLIMIVELFRGKENPVVNIALTALPVFYIAIPLAMLVMLFSEDTNTQTTSPYVLLGYFILIWTGDTMAYLGGMAYGRHKLFERISPKKTWEGSITGAVFAVAMGWFLSLYFTELDVWQWTGMALIVVVTGTLGDLTESLLKRNACVKDSGTLLPGHGGFLDRFDSALFSAPMVILYLYIYKLLV